MFFFKNTYVFLFCFLILIFSLRCSAAFGRKIYPSFLDNQKKDCNFANKALANN